jgi:hypothetical protein
VIHFNNWKYARVKVQVAKDRFIYLFIYTRYQDYYIQEFTSKNKYKLELCIVQNTGEHQVGSML